MKVEETKRRLELIMTQEEIERLTFYDFGEEGERLGLKTEVLADVHGMTKKGAIRYLKNLVRATKESFWLVVIHGCNHGRAIKDALGEGGFDEERASVPYEIEGNEGRTLFTIAEA